MRRCEVCGKESYCMEYDCCIECLTEGLAKAIKPERIKRACLKCGGEFLAVGRFNRICFLCQQENKEIYAD